MERLKAKIIENKKITQSFYKMRIESVYLAKNSKPGQFIEAKCSDGNEPLLRRPLGVHRILKDEIEILYEVVGKGTELLSGKKTGGYLDIIGPLGNGFKILSGVYSDKRPAVLVGGGVGIAPLLALAQKLVCKVHSRQSIVHRKKVYILIGAKTREHILCKKEFKALGAEVIISTEDGSDGKKGLITESLQLLLLTIDCGLSAIYACGPTGMLKIVAKIAEEKRIPCQVSLEERMACGVGVCLGCPVKIRTAYSVQPACPAGRLYEYKMVCKDGPVFNAEEIVW